MTIHDGKHKAKATQAALGRASTGSEQVAVAFELTEGEAKGSSITWHGYFTDRALERTVATLRTCGWTGDDLSDLSGIAGTEVVLVTETEEYGGEFRARIKWVNAPGSGLALKAPLDGSAARSFGASMRARIAALGGSAPPRTPEPPPHDDDDFNAPF